MQYSMKKKEMGLALEQLCGKNVSRNDAMRKLLFEEVWGRGAKLTPQPSILAYFQVTDGVELWH